jgi:hypothetical protein
MRKIQDDTSGQLILIACLSMVLAILLIMAYEYSTLTSGEKSINQENENSFYFYKSLKDRYSIIYRSNNPDYFDMTRPDNITLFENEMKEFALIHGYSMDIRRNGNQARIIFVDKDLRIDEFIVR